MGGVGKWFLALMAVARDSRLNHETPANARMTENIDQVQKQCSSVEQCDGAYHIHLLDQSAGSMNHKAVWK
jgi:hypothetical protein